jgi:hypothetical protein
MDDINEELEDILIQSKDHTLELSEKFTSIFKDIDDDCIKRFLDDLDDEIEINDIENIKKLDYVEDAYRDPDDPMMIKIICKKPIKDAIFHLEVVPKEGE